ncbi:hypothetical protein C8R46DRAFT_1365524 [Mycena filopes]|nr:hypothetical protein C8R46DRAFT_1365524 [Mycena filopes]
MPTMQLESTQRRGPSLERQAQICDSWLARSHNCPVSLELRIRHDVDAIDDVLAPIYLHRARLEDVKLLFWEEASSLLLLEGPLPCLRHLDLQFGALPTNFKLQGLPLLRSVILDNVAALQVELPWAQLTSITLRYTSPQLFLPILRHASSLAGTANITLVALESLTFTDATTIGPPRDYLPVFVATALRDLRIPQQCLGENPIQVLQAFIARSGCRLSELCVTGELSTVQDLDAYREAFPLISRLTLDGWIVDEDLDRDQIYELDELEL